MTTRRLIIIAVLLGLVSANGLSQNSEKTSGAIQGVVSTIDPDGGRSVAPGTQISLDGSAHLEVKSDGEGQFAFTSVPAGGYTLRAEAPGLAATQTVAVTAGNVSEVLLEMRLVMVADSTTVSANTDQVETKQSSGTNTIGESAVEHMPNRNEHFDSLLPLVPGLVRGPSGRINMKGARASQKGIS